jgi:hypothetical protein
MYDVNLFVSNLSTENLEVTVEESQLLRDLEQLDEIGKMFDPRTEDTDILAVYAHIEQLEAQKNSLQKRINADRKSKYAKYSALKKAAKEEMDSVREQLTDEIERIFLTTILPSINCLHGLRLRVMTILNEELWKSQKLIDMGIKENDAERLVSLYKEWSELYAEYRRRNYYNLHDIVEGELAPLLRERNGLEYEIECLKNELEFYF